MVRLSKSKILSGLQCPRRLWLEVHQPESAEDYSGGVERRLNAGHQADEVVHGLIPAGYLINDGVSLDAALRITEQHLNEEPDRPLFESTISSHNALPSRHVWSPVDQGGVAYCCTSFRLWSA